MAQISRRLRFEILRRDGYTCRYCGASAPDVQLELDHVVPDTLGGSNDASNLVTACVACNRGKSSVPPDAVIVEDVAQDAIRWARAMKEAAKAKRAERAGMRQLCNLFAAYYDDIFKGAPVEVPDSWPDSIEQFIIAGLTVEDMVPLLETVKRKVGWGRYEVHPDKAWRYFCGCAWRAISDLQEDARRIVEGEGEVTCG